MDERITPKLKKHRRPLMIAGIVAAVLLVVLTAGLIWAGNFFYDFALNPHSSVGFSGPEGLPDNEYTRWLLAASTNVFLTS
ncbi:MAG: hypothetical protein RR336_10990, partial [Oscillospiraceae bacterium]